MLRATGRERVPPAGLSYYVVLKNGATELGRYGFDPYPQVDATEVYTPTLAGTIEGATVIPHLAKFFGEDFRLTPGLSFIHRANELGSGSQKDIETRKDFLPKVPGQPKKFRPKVTVVGNRITSPGCGPALSGANGRQ